MPLLSQAANGHQAGRHTQGEPARGRQEVLAPARPVSCGTLRAANPIARPLAHISREVLAQQPVGVLACPALPGAVRVAEVDLDSGGDPQLGVLGQFLAAVPGQRSPQLLGQGRDRGVMASRTASAPRPASGGPRGFVEPPWGVEPQTYALRGCRSGSRGAPPAPRAPHTALPALADLRERDPSCQNSCQGPTREDRLTRGGERRIWHAYLTCGSDVPEIFESRLEGDR
jgi:hypothetical protein